MDVEHTALITNDAVVLGLLAVILGAIFWSAHSPRAGFRKFYKYVPALLLCYFIPSIFNSLGVIDGEHSKLYFVSSRYLLPTTLVLLTLSIDLKAILRLGPKALTMFFTGTVGIVIGGPLAILITSMFAPELVGGNGPDAVWRGMTTVAGSWIGGGANQAAMREIFEVGQDMFSVMVTIDILVANVWMAVLLFLAGRAKEIDRRLGADATAIDELKDKVVAMEAKHARIPSLPDIMLILAVGFGATGIAHVVADVVAPAFDRLNPNLSRFSLTSGFFWLVVSATVFGVGLSFTRARQLEWVGASKIGSAMLYILVASIGMEMNVVALRDSPGLFVVGAIWMAFHASSMILVAYLIKAPLFFMAVGSQANVGGAASAPVVASAFHPALAPVGVLLAVLGYTVGTGAAWLCGMLMQAAAGG
ncbi:MAG: DUF819 family protein [Acidobacteriota bacterium]|nr:DUF819 family protein [Acidobacteriota bacterium]